MSTTSTNELNLETPARQRILVADDDLVMRTFIRAIFGAEYELVDAADGREALEILEGSSAFACILADDRMPHATGFDVAIHVRDTARLRHIPVILMTAKETNTTARQVESRRVGAAAFLNKPFTRTQIVALVEMLMRMRNIRKTA